MSKSTFELLVASFVLILACLCMSSTADTSKYEAWTDQRDGLNRVVEMYDTMKMYADTMGHGHLLPEIEINKIEYQNRELEAGVYKFCVYSFNQGRPNNHVITNVDFNGLATMRWLPYGDFCVFIDENEGTLTFEGAVIPLDTAQYGSPVMQIQAVFSAKVDYKSCYCASPLAWFVKSEKNPSYGMIQNECTMAEYNKRPDKASDLLFCPKCEQYQCSKANGERKSNGAPKPVYKEWDFFKEVSGTLSGEGFTLFRQEVKKHFINLDDTLTSCTLDISNLPLPQFHCSDLSDPFNGYGYGVNGKNQHCGFASWFKCKEDLHIQSVKHIGDMNIEILPCPTHAPTYAPTTVTPEPTPQPSNFPTPQPSNFPTPAPSDFPTPQPSDFPTPAPSNFPTPQPSPQPSNFPTSQPSNNPTLKPTTPAPSNILIPPTPPPGICYWYNISYDDCIDVKDGEYGDFDRCPLDD
uniref:Uncharacterized protein n=1 Tax=Aplanochytrium stocchinoi TaxID=215587 RepID=A0A7S3LPI5_9STRA|mmetsp:Transcript_18774/g.23009  ORF Transcript_18774/g.23009 Transcript_18774/m.23009 type:complete len:465 (-) Transcript_18774:102-1496(-)|eukprot:CAMPEP_0204840644 /NCGR_PEP_ID=MMETSP1346-20131115/38330_1 /ASSEMBLY_ACC=CAM_ASM_000771 /TAXON_ID=215587 /ORGANISM="Aplanochytrium stocchinoi, Strain GSBS06" /LENGTH=464 /DNA_ID=CAMNT_0051978167 /DNA_START=115 /DNA_END=1509 /DNA_ORIENTATION=-